MKRLNNRMNSRFIVLTILLLHFFYFKGFMCYGLNKEGYGIDWQDGNSVIKLLDSISREQYTDTLRISLQEAKEMAIKNNRSLLNARMDIKRAQAQRWQAIAAMLLQVEADAQFTDDFGFQLALTGNAMPNSIAHSLVSTMTLNGQMVINALLQKTAKEMQEINNKITENTLIENVSNTYMTLLATKEIIQLEKEFLANLQKIYEQTLKMVEVGVLENAQADLIKINVNKLNTSIKNNERGLNCTESTFKTLLVIDPTSKIILTDSFHNFTSPENILGDLLMPFNTANNLTYQLSKKNLKIAQQNWHMAGWQFGPSLRLQYVYNRMKYYGNTGLNLTPTNAFSVTVAFPLFSSGQRIANVIDKKIAYEIEENKLADITDNLNIQYKQLTYNIINSYENYLTEKENIEVINHVLEDVTNKQKWGLSSTQELITATDDLIQSQQSYLSTMLNLIQNKTALEVFLNNK